MRSREQDVREIAKPYLDYFKQKFKDDLARDKRYSHYYSQMPEIKRLEVDNDE